MEPIATFDAPPADAPPAEDAPEPRRARTWILGVIAAVIVVIDLVSITVNLPYFELSPGTTSPVAPMITVPANQRHPVSGAVMLTTVLLRQARPIDFVYAWFNHDVQIVSRESILGNLPTGELQQINNEEMQGSVQDAQVAALRRLGYRVPEHGTGALVEEVVPKTPAAPVVHVGDTITAIDGRPVQLDTDVTTALVADHPGQNIALTLDRQGRTQNVAVTLTRRPDNPNRAFLGVALGTRGEHFDLPFKVSINSGDIGGPSAGLAFTLGIIDVLVNGKLTGGQRIAATGTIDPDGNVGDVGGVAEKTVSVSNAGAVLFLVPPGEYRDAVSHAGPHLKVVKVSTLDQALAAIAANGGDVSGVPPPPPAGQ
ncbi:MAG TPA: PDZ domain-containing protein [Acidimicrobiales bacterium]|nr:PDZ domain-containing protein [Acidimicrobiales bacterium]